MKTVLDIPITKHFTIFQDGYNSSFLRINETKHNGNNAMCIQSFNPTYDKGVFYFIQLDIEVVPVGII